MTVLGILRVGDGGSISLTGQVLRGEVETSQLGEGVGTFQWGRHSETRQPESRLDLLRPLLHKAWLSSDTVDAVAAGAPGQVGTHGGGGGGVAHGLQEVF